MSNSVVGALRVNLGLDSAEFQDGLKSARQTLRRTGEQMRNIGIGLSAAVTAPLAFAARDAIALAAVQESAMALVTQGIETTGGAAGFAADELFRIASALQEATKFGDEDILRDVTAQLLTFTNVTGDEFERAQQAILDVATVLDKDLKSTAIQVGKALNDPVRGLSALAESGIQFTEEQREVVKALVETGDVAAAQGLILDELAKQYGGQAAAAADTFAGSVSQLGNAWGDLKEEFGALLQEFLPPLIEALRGAIAFVQDLDPATKELSVKVGLLAAALGPALTALGLMVTALAALTAPVGIAVGVITGLAAIYVTFKNDIDAALAAVGRFAVEIVNYLSGLPDQIRAVFANLKEQMIQIGRDIIDGLRQGIVEKYEAVKATIANFGTDIADTIRQRLGIQSPSRVFHQIGVQIMEGLNNGLDETGSQVQATMESVASTLSRSVSGLFKAVLFEGESFKSALSNLLSQIGSRLLDAGFNSLFSAIIPEFAAGTNYAPGGLALVGERGPELVNLPRGSQVVPNHRIGDLGGGKVQVELVGSGLTLADDGRIMAEVNARVGQGIGAYDRRLPDRIAAYKRDPRKRG